MGRWLAGLLALGCLLPLSCAHPWKDGKPVPPASTRRPWADGAGPGLVGFPVAVGDRAHALEKVECSDVSGDWVLIYEGTVMELSPSGVRLRLEKRYGYRFHPEAEGINPTDWWCVPRKRHCYAEVGFGDWGGPHARNDVVSFPRDEVFDARSPLATIVETLLRRRCHP